MIVTTKGIVLRIVKYGETSIICSVFTELLGLQSYLVKGVRSEKKQSSKGNIFRPGNILDLQVYHQQDKNLQYIREFQLGYFYRTIGESVIKNTILIFAIDVLNNLVQTPDAQEALFEFTTHFLESIDNATDNDMANMPIFFLKEAAKLTGYAISENYSETECYLNTYEGRFQSSPGQAIPVFDKALSFQCHQLISECEMQGIIKINIAAADRKAIMDGYLHFLQWHDKSFKPLRCLPVLEAILH